MFLTANDFKNKIATHCSNHTHIKHHEVFKRDIIEVKTKDSTYKYKKKDIYGYRENNGATYRLYNDKPYHIINPNETILIYKVSNGPSTKEQEQTFSYYFSKDASQEIKALTLNDLENTFKGDKMFEELLEIHFRKDNELLEYDNMHKMYKLNRLLELAKEGKLN